MKCPFCGNEIKQSIKIPKHIRLYDHKSETVLSQVIENTVWIRPAKNSSRNRIPIYCIVEDK